MKALAKHGVPDLIFRIRPSRDFDYHVQDLLLFVCVQGDIVKWRYRNTVLLEKDSKVGSSRPAMLVQSVFTRRRLIRNSLGGFAEEAAHSWIINDDVIAGLEE